jgi:hypothetical protein
MDGDSGDEIASGLVHKRGKWLKRNKLRWFVLTAATLSLYDVGRNGMPHGKARAVFSVAATRVAGGPASSAPHKITLAARRHGNKALTAEEKVELEFEDPRAWLTAFSAAKAFAMVGSGPGALALCQLQPCVGAHTARAGLLRLRAAAAVSQGLHHHARLTPWPHIRLTVALFQAVVASCVATRRRRRGMAVLAAQGLLRAATRRRRHAMKRKRRLVVREIVCTEETYVANLRLAADHYMRPLQELMREEVWTIFGGWAEIISYNTKFLTLLRSLVGAGGVGYHTSAGLAKAFLSAEFEAMRGYGKFVKAFDRANAKAESLMHSNGSSAQIRELLQRTAKEDGGLQLRDLLIQPVQRFPRYKLLLNEYLKSLSTVSSHCGELGRAVQRVVEMTQEFNEEKRRFDDASRLAELRLVLGGGGGDSTYSSSWSSSSSRVVKEGAMRKAAQKGNYVVVLDRALLVIK